MKSWIKTVKCSKRIGHILCSIIILAGWAPVLGESKSKLLSVEDVIQKVEESQGRIQDVQMDVRMEMKDTLSGTKQNMEGVIKVKPPNNVLAHYSKPTEQILYISENLIQMYQPNQQMVYQQKSPEGKNTPVYLGVSKELKKYASVSRVSIAHDSDNEVVLLFVPLSENSGFTKMKVSIRKKDWWPFQMEVETTSGSTKARFSNFVFDQGIKDKAFKFKPPKDAQVVEGVIF
jgi:outer membrane lipoprotein-sorting protein